MNAVKAFLFSCLLPFLPLAAAGQNEITLMSYNVENLFDDVSDGTEYSSYDPAKSGWNRKSYLEKLSALSKVIRSAVPGGPDVLALQEVENAAVLDRLCSDYLFRLNYSYKTIVPVPGQAVHCAVASRLPIRRVGALQAEFWKGNPQRVILEVEILHRGHRLFLYNCHWKSKTGGIVETEEARRASARVLERRVRELLREDPCLDIVVIGDLNENLEEPLLSGQSLARALNPLDSSVSAGQDGAEAGEGIFLTHDPLQAGLGSGRVVLYEPWYELPVDRRGSYVYQKIWQTPDHILLSAGLFDTRGFSYEPGWFKVVRSSYLLETGTGFPKRTDAAGGGYSDHLPLLLRLRVQD